MIRIGVDFGGTKIEAAALDATGEFRSRIRVPTPAAYEDAIETVRDLVDAAESEAGCGRGTVGIGMPGSLSPSTGIVRNANTTWLNGRAFREDLIAALHREVRLANDANCLALSEAVDGAANGSKITFAVILGTGCGGGLVVNRQLVEGAHGLGGEFGHIPLPWPSIDELDVPPCWCGLRGCLEMWVSGSGLKRDYLHACGKPHTGEQIVELARGGDVHAAAALERYTDRLGRALAVICNVVDPDTIVLGGGLSNVPELYEKLPPIVNAYVFGNEWPGRIVRAHWGDSSGVRGAARLWTE